MNVPPLRVPAATASTPTVPAITLTVVGGEASGLRLGQTIQATVQRLVADQLVLQLSGASGPVLTVAATGELPNAQALTLRVRALQPQVVFETLSAGSSTAAQIPRSAPASGPPFLLQPGQQLTVRVLGEPVGDRVLVAINGSPVQALVRSGPPTQAFWPYPPGSDVRVEVVRGHPEPVLRAFDRPAPDAVQVGLTSQMLRERLPARPLGEVLAPLLADPAPAGPALRDLLGRLRALLPADGAPDAGRLREFVRDGGLQLEARLGRVARGDALPEEAARAAHDDVKGLLLRALDESADPSTSPERTALLERHLRGIEAQQAANLLAQARGDPVLLQLPLFFPDAAAATAHLAVQREPRRDGDAATGGYNLLLHVDLPDLGAVRVDARLRDGAMGRPSQVIFYAETAAGKERLQAELGALREALSRVQAGPVELAVRSWQQQPTEQRATFQAMVQGLPRSGSSLDVRA